ncbi:hypothetical protein A9168_11640 [Macellibacteroides sp. HH-ZS]|nr:hypothetical protein A9168_11640 [Macellibacteroides sp. HH-ZS]
MISMYTKQEIIIDSFRQGKSQRTIARDLQINRKTVKKYILEHEALLQSVCSKEAAQSIALSDKPAYNMTVPRQKVKLTTDVQEIIDEQLLKNKVKLEEGLRKQMMKKKDIHEELFRQGFDVSYSTVCNYIRFKENSQTSKEAYIRQAYLAGDVCEFDWGEIKLLIGGKRTSLHLAVFTCAYSNWRYAYVYHRQDTLSFMEAHTRFFRQIGGVHREMVYDNMRVAVAKFVGRHEKEPTRALLELRGYYHFTHRFTNFYRGNEKGHVERSVEYVRRKAFAPKDSFASAIEAQEWLDSTLNKLNALKQQGTGKSAEELLAEEKKVLAKHPSSVMICSEQIQLRADKYATVSYQGNRYSVPDNLVGLFVDVSVRSRQIHIYSQNRRVAIHHRSYKSHDWVIDIELLSYCRDHMVSEEKLEESVKRLLSTCGNHATIEKLRALLGNNSFVAPTVETKDNITLKAKEQLSWITELMHQTNDNGQYKQSNNRI